MLRILIGGIGSRPSQHRPRRPWIPESRSGAGRSAVPPSQSTSPPHPRLVRSKSVLPTRRATDCPSEKGKHVRRRAIAARRGPALREWAPLRGSVAVEEKQKEPVGSTGSSLQSGRQDSNLRPSEPHSDTLPSCATPRRIAGQVYRAGDGIVKINRAPAQAHPVPTKLPRQAGFLLR